MKNFILSGVALAAMTAGGTAIAADSARSWTPQYGKWSGPYLGGGIGAKWADSLWTATVVNDPILEPVVKTADASSPRQYDSLNARVGGYAGYNWQYQGWVLGFEIDLFSDNRTTTRAGFPGCTIACAPTAPGPGATVTAVKLKWDTSARVRFGYVTSPDLLLYGTAGAVWQKFETTGTCENSGTDPVCFDTGGASKTGTNSRTRLGLTYGAGLEWKLERNLLVRAEYRYSRFGSWDEVFFAGEPAVFPGADTYRYQMKVDTSVVTLGLAYKFY